MDTCFFKNNIGRIPDARVRRDARDYIFWHLNTSRAFERVAQIHAYLSVNSWHNNNTNNLPKSLLVDISRYWSLKFTGRNGTEICDTCSLTFLVHVPRRSRRCSVTSQSEPGSWVIVQIGARVYDVRYTWWNFHFTKIIGRHFMTENFDIYHIVWYFVKW